MLKISIYFLLALAVSACAGPQTSFFDHAPVFQARTRAGW